MARRLQGPPARAQREPVLEGVPEGPRRGRRNLFSQSMLISWRMNNNNNHA